MLIRDAEIEQYIHSHPDISAAVCFLTVSLILTPTGCLSKYYQPPLPVWDFRVASMGGRRLSFGAVHPRSPSTTRNCCWPSQGFGVGPAETRRIRFLRVRAIRTG